ncbi:MAG: hypothetical protein WDN45_16945 [Caulobacteraceae bacterium]
MANTDNVWIEGRRARPADPDRPVGPGADGHLHVARPPRPIDGLSSGPRASCWTRRAGPPIPIAPDPLPPFNNIGVQIIKPGLLDGRSGAFSIVPSGSGWGRRGASMAR